MPGLSSSLERLGTETAFDVLARARALERAGREVVHLEIGEPDFPTPAHVAEAGIAAIRAGDPLGGGDAGRAAAARGARLQLRPRRARVPARRAHETRDPQLAGQPDG